MTTKLLDTLTEELEKLNGNLTTSTVAEALAAAVTFSEQISYAPPCLAPQGDTE